VTAYPSPKSGHSSSYTPVKYMHLLLIIHVRSPRAMKIMLIAEIHE